MKTPRSKEISIETDHPDAWQRFERAVDVVAKSPPQHKVKGQKHTPKRKAKTKRG